MALYQYACPEHEAFDLSYPMGKAPEQALCPSCGVWSNRQIVAAPVHFRAKGFYKTGG